MADLKNFIYSGLQSGTKFDLYLSRWPKIGNGKSEIVESLHLKVEGSAKVFGQTFSGSIEITMPDKSPVGRCIVSINNGKAEQCAYKVDGRTLIINHPETQIKVQNNDKKWTWVHINSPVSIKIGILPTDVALSDEESLRGFDLV